MKTHFIGEVDLIVTLFFATYYLFKYLKKNEHYLNITFFMLALNCRFHPELFKFRLKAITIKLLYF